VRRGLQDRLTFLATIITLVAFGVPFIRTLDPLLAIGVVGLAYVVLVPTLFLVIPAFTKPMSFLEDLPTPKRDRAYWLTALTMVCLALAFWGICAFTLWLVNWDLAAPSLPFVCGIFILAGLIPSALYTAYVSPRSTHMRCPECANEVLRGARVCQYCGFRWKPPLP
jgi:hypothetical protein